jgi:hypothetical protein
MIKAVLAAIGVSGGALMLGLTAGASNGTAVLRGALPSNEVFVVNGVPKVFTFTCDEHRVQRPDGSARDTAHCVLDANQTPPESAVHELTAAGYVSDFSSPGRLVSRDHASQPTGTEW